MQEFTRSLTREIQIDGERLAVTMDKEGLTIRPVGSRRPPATLTWAACVCAAVNGSADTAPEQLSSALAGLKSGRKNTPVPAAAAAAPLLPPAPPATPAGELAGLLGRIDHALAAHRAAFVTALAPGASAQELDEAEKQLGRPLPGDLRTLLAWHNGQNPDGVAAFEQSFSLMNAAQIAALPHSRSTLLPAGRPASFPSSRTVPKVTWSSIWPSSACPSTKSGATSPTAPWSPIPCAAGSNASRKEWSTAPMRRTRNAGPFSARADSFALPPEEKRKRKRCLVCSARNMVAVGS